MQQDWVVYSRPGLSKPERVIDYLARYSHRTAISNRRLLLMKDGVIRFRYKDYRDHDRMKVMALRVEEFIRRFLLHVLPKGLMRIRHYGFLANSCRCRKLTSIRSALATRNAAPDEEEQAIAIIRFDGYPCPKCRQGTLRPIAELAPLRWEGG